MNLIVLMVLSLGHLVVDLGSGLAGYGQLNILMQSTTRQIFLYNTLAFGIQPLMGYGIDRLKISRLAAVSGCVLIGAALLQQGRPDLVITLAGVGNALFHLGGGVAILRLFPGKAWPLGVFVGPGALGIAWSRTLSVEFTNNVTPVFTILMFVALMIIFLKYQPEQEGKPNALWRGKYALPIILLLLVSTFVRSYLGINLPYPWKNGGILMTVFVLAVAGGKMFGGFGADYLGRVKSAITALILAAVLLAWGASTPACGIAGIFLFQSTMAVTLLTLYEQMPDYPALAFGILCFGLWTGIPASAVLKNLLPNTPVITMVMVLVSSLALWAALLWSVQNQQVPNRFKIR